MKLTSDWTIVGSVEGGEILARDTENRVWVSFPSDIAEAEVRDILADKGIEVGNGVVFEAGEAENETVAFFEKP
jgi:tRNA nucleotidyltransferase (CCA-adding enzyme)